MEGNGEALRGRVLHPAALAYALDYGLLGTALLPHGLTYLMRRVQAASLGPRCLVLPPFPRWTTGCSTRWTVPAAAGARGFTEGSLFTRDGALVASTAQEGLVWVRQS